jgi:pimeloyl-ACP methyl ester carboxylesterase
MNIYFEEFGKENEKSLLFIHGAGIPGWFWKKQVSYFSKAYHCIVIDLPDHGKSSTKEFTSIDEVAEELLLIIEKSAHNKKAILIGHSLGAKIATFMLARNSDFIERAIIASALFHKSMLINMINTQTLIRLNVNWLKNSPKILKMQAKTFHFDDIEMEKSFIEDYKTLDYHSVIRYLEAFSSRMELPENLSKVTLPVLIITGEKEPSSMKKSAIKLQCALPNSKSIVMAKCNHIYPVQSATLFNSLVESWIAG